ncbi:hypothetical protein [Caballeronia sp. dw_19]|uniref:hypothetical protein n=1 Tax=Caballeronia sp. dw_19 TaxID=2719791 RepID=UPI001BD24D89|nr:hypothetical protein [Caballeronia sp. dw_19]
MFKVRYALMDEAGGAAGATGGVASGGATTAAAGAGTASTAGDGSGAASTASGAGNAGTGTATGASALAAGSTAATGTTPDFIPEKYRVTKDDGSLDVDASARKLADGYGELSKRFGSGDAAPKTAAEYAVVVPDALKEAVGDISADPMFTQFRDDMHGLGLSQKQFDGVMSRYFELAPKLAGGAAQLSTDTAVAALRETWKDEGEFKKQIGLSYQAADTIAKAAGMTYEDIDKAGLGNNPTFIKLMAAIGPEFSEGKPVEGAGGSTFTSDQAIKELMMSDANTNTKHPQHAATRAKIDAYYARKHGNTPVA